MVTVYFLSQTGSPSTLEYQHMAHGIKDDDSHPYPFEESINESQDQSAEEIQRLYHIPGGFSWKQK